VLNQFKTHINSNLSFLKEGKLLIAISGGIDSVVLTHLCYSLKLDIALAHCNFNLRGTKSDADEDFVVDLAENLDVEVFTQSFDTEAYANEHKLSMQMAARELRYNWFYELSEQLHYDYILTAHHADDNLETFLINLSRGTGLDGLVGIPEQNDKIVRPLLPFSRHNIEVYATKQTIKWREDASNASDKYLRNALRHQVTPKLKELSPNLLQNFQKTIVYLQESQSIIKDRIDLIKDLVVSNNEDDSLSFSITELQKLKNPKAYLFQLLNTYGFTEWNDITNLLDAQTGKQILSATHRLIKNRSTLLLTEISSYSTSEIQISKDLKNIQLPNGQLAFDTTTDLPTKDLHTAFVDKDLLKFPLTVRQWREGDYFYPLGMDGKKKLSKFFKDEKLSLLDKDKILLLCSENDVVWIVNKRQDNRYRVTSNTKHTLRITYTK